MMSAARSRPSRSENAGQGVGGRCSHTMHDRSKDIDLRIPTMPERSTPGLHRTGTHCLHQARGGVGVG